MAGFGSRWWVGVALGAALTSGCDDSQGGSGSNMGHSIVGDGVAPSTALHSADARRAGPTRGFAVATAPAFRGGDAYQIPAGSRIPPPVTPSGIGGAGPAGTASGRQTVRSPPAPLGSGGSGGDMGTGALSSPASPMSNPMSNPVSHPVSHPVSNPVSNPDPQALAPRNPNLGADSGVIRAPPALDLTSFQGRLDQREIPGVYGRREGGRTSTGRGSAIDLENRSLQHLSGTAGPLASSPGITGYFNVYSLNGKPRTPGSGIRERDAALKAEGGVSGSTGLGNTHPGRNSEIAAAQPLSQQFFNEHLQYQDPLKHTPPVPVPDPAPSLKKIP